MMSERRYNEEEVASIFEQAAEAQHAARAITASSEGLTLSELQDVGREAGISPELVARAARSIEREPGLQRRLLGLPVGVGRTVDLGRTLSDEEWERLVMDLRETFDARGVVRGEGRFRQWTNGNLQALVEPTATGDRVRLRTRKGDAFGLMIGGLSMLGGAAAVALTSYLAPGAADATRPAAFLAIAGIGMISFVALRLPGWARLRLRQMDEVAGRLEQSEPESVGP